MAKPTGDWTVERLTRHHDRNSFDCGNAQLNDWLQQLSGQYERRDLARTYVLTRTGDVKILGYYGMSSHSVSRDLLPTELAKGLPRIDVPVVLIGRLAVDRTVPGQGLGRLLMTHAFRRALSISDLIGVRAVEVDAIDETARRFYERHGFSPLLDDPRHLYLPLSIVRAMNLIPL